MIELAEGEATTMELAFFRIPVTGGAEAEELNRFIRSVRMLNVHREFVAQGDASFWAVAVEYLTGDAAASSARPGSRTGGVTTKVDYKTVLPSEDFVLFARLREWRKQTAAGEATPVYTIFTNEQLAEMAKRRCSTLSALGEIDGVGQGRTTKYGADVLKILGEESNGTGE